MLWRVAERAAYASRALDAELSRAALEPRDEALATEIVYGALRVLPELDRRIALHLKRPLATQDGVLRAALRAGCYQLFHLTRTPAHAVVDESVRVLRGARGRELAGVLNAVLRKLALDAAAVQTAGTSDSPAALVLPAWLDSALRESLGGARAEAWLAQTAAPPLCLRVSEGYSRDNLAQALRAARPRAAVELGQVSHAALLLRRAGDPRVLPGYAEGHFAVQEEGAQAIALALGARPGEAVADLCAGHGGKTTLLAAAIGAQGQLAALDLDERKLERIPPELARLGLAACHVELHPVDLRVGTGGLAGSFDRVLVDAPCSGLGTIRRRPELLLRVRAEDPARFAELQFAILAQASALVRPGGVLLYAVCSPTAAEGPEVARRFDAERTGFERLDRGGSGALCEPRLEPLVPDGDGMVRLGPWSSAVAADSPDVYQFVRWRRARRG